jgi:tryptophan 2,3-dioxygenase
VSDTPTPQTMERPATGQTPYSAWMQTDTLHSLQRTVSDHPGEHAWIVHVQVSELYWMLIIKEMQSARRSCGPTTSRRPGAPCSASLRTMRRWTPSGARSTG